MREHSIFVIDSYSKDSVFTAVKRDESSKQGMLKGYDSSIEGIYERGTFFVKNSIIQNKASDTNDSFFYFRLT